MCNNDVMVSYGGQTRVVGVVMGVKGRDGKRGREGGTQGKQEVRCSWKVRVESLTDLGVREQRHSVVGRWYPLTGSNKESTDQETGWTGKPAKLTRLSYCDRR